MSESHEHQPADLASATQAVRDEYARRALRPKPGLGEALWYSRLDAYERAFGAAGMLPLADRDILDCGCGSGRWLDFCCQRWGATDSRCVGFDLRDVQFAKWHAEHPHSRITLRAHPAHELPDADGRYDIVHHSMMFSSILSAELRAEVARQMWRVRKPGGCIVSYDFWINPTNRQTTGIRTPELRRLFPEARVVHAETITLAPPLARLLMKISTPLVLGLEKLRLLNTHQLVVLR